MENKCTTAGYKGTFPYQKFIETLVKMCTEPHGSAFLLGGTWRIPVIVGQYEKTFVQDQQRSETFSEASFGREYESIWAGTAEDAFYNVELFDKNRCIQKPEYEFSGRSTKDAYYVVSVDVGRKGCQSVACIFKVTPQSMGPAIKSLVNIYTMEDAHFEDQAMWLKGLYYKYKAKQLVIDGNGLGIGLIDYLIKPQKTELGDYYPPFGVSNDNENYYKKYKTNDTEDNAVYIIKANAPLNTEAHSIARESLVSGKIKFLIDVKAAREKLLGTRLGQEMKPEERKLYLYPYEMTTILKEEMLNLRETTEGVNIILKQSNKRIGKDKYSALIYGLYYIKQEEESKKKHHKFNAKDWKFFTPGK